METHHFTLLTVITGCWGQFGVHTEHNAEGGIPHHNADSPEKCAELCSMTQTCVAFDYDRNNPPYTGAICWIHDNVNLVMKPQKAVDHYVMGVCQGNTAC